MLFKDKCAGGAGPHTGRLQPEFYSFAAAVALMHLSVVNFRGGYRTDIRARSAAYAVCVIIYHKTRFRVFFYTLERTDVYAQTAVDACLRLVSEEPGCFIFRYDPEWSGSAGWIVVVLIHAGYRTGIASDAFFAYKEYSAHDIIPF